MEAQQDAQSLITLNAQVRVMEPPPDLVALAKVIGRELPPALKVQVALDDEVRNRVTDGFAITREVADRVGATTATLPSLAPDGTSLYIGASIETDGLTRLTVKVGDEAINVSRYGNPDLWLVAAQAALRALQEAAAA